MTETLNQGLNGLRSPNNNSKSTSNAPVAKEELADPTRTNENFRAALERVFKGKVNGTPTASATPLQRPALPKIALIANIYGANKEDNHAMLRINEQTKMVGMGDKFDIIDNNQLIEIEVMDIAKNVVKLQLKPSNEMLILRWWF